MIDAKTLAIAKKYTDEKPVLLLPHLLLIMMI